MSESPYGKADKSTGGTEPAVPEAGLKSRKSAARTIASLNIDIQAGMDGRGFFLLPPEARSQSKAEKYPLPSSVSDLYKLAVLPLHLNARNCYATYVRRAKKAYQMHCRRRDPDRLETASGRADQMLERIEKTTASVSEEASKARAAIVLAAATLTDLYGLIRTGDYMILKAFVEGTEVHGERITADTFNTTQGRILTHITRLGGIAEEDKKEAEGAVFEQAAESLRKRVLDSETVGLKAGQNNDEPTH